MAPLCRNGAGRGRASTVPFAVCRGSLSPPHTCRAPLIAEALHTPMPVRRGPAVWRPWRRVALPALVASLVAACGRERPADAPALRELTAAALEAPPVPAATLSRFGVPLDYDFTPVLAVVERAVPATFGSLDTRHQLGDDRRKHYAYEATRGPFTTFVVGSEVHLRTTLSYAARGYYDPPVGPTLRAGCGTGGARPEIVVELVTPLTLTPSWRLRSATRVASVAPASARSRDRCRVSILRYDVTDRVVAAARKGITAKLPEIDRTIGRVDLTERATRWWALLNRPIRLADGVWLVLQPQQLRAGRVTGRGHVLTVEAGLDAYPKVVTGPAAEPAGEPRGGPVPPLPPLEAATGSPGFRILLEGIVDYATASRAVTTALQGRTVTQAGRSVTVRSVAASPAPGGRLALTVDFTGDANGTLRFVGAPRYDAARGRIVVPDLEYDLDTDNRLVDAVAWIRSDALRALFREKAELPVAPVLERGRALLTKGLNRTVGGAMTLSATVDSVAVDGVYVTAPGVMVRASAAGNARVSVRQKR